MLDDADIAELTAFRHALHRRPEASGEEAQTAAAVADQLRALAPDMLLTGLGGHGVAAVYSGLAPGPTVMLRAELDGLPILDRSGVPHQSEIEGRGHLCGHDGHTVILCGLARLLSRRRPARGRAVLMFQPAEEDGSGAAAVIADPRYGSIAPDHAFSLHNMPGIPLGAVALRPGPMACASLGLRIRLDGRTAHAAQPENGNAPTLALAGLIERFAALAPGGPLDERFRLATITHASLGDPVFGIAPGRAELWLTLRAMTDAGLEGLVAQCEALVREQAGGFGVSMTRHEHFLASANDPQATAILSRAVAAAGLQQSEIGQPMRPSEDFGRFGHAALAAMAFLGAGESHPALHTPEYDFPDALIAPGVRIFAGVIDDMLGRA